MQPLVNDAQRRSVEKFLEAVIRDAYSMADMTAAFLEAQGLRPSKEPVRLAGGILPESPAMTGANAFLLNLGAALKIAAWECAGYGLRCRLICPVPQTRSAAWSRQKRQRLAKTAQLRPNCP